MKKLYLGIDVGSVSANTVIMNDHQEVLEEHYTRIKGQPLQTVKRILEGILERIPAEQFHSLSFTGIGGKLFSELLGGHFVNEIIAQTKAVQHFYPRSEPSLTSEAKIQAHPSRGREWTHQDQ